jgi:hypothetical protein
MTKPGNAKGAGGGSPPDADPLAVPGGPDFETKRHSSMIEDLRHRAIEQENPLYVWEAILRSFSVNDPLPDWCIVYLKTTAILLHRLMQNGHCGVGNDTRSKPRRLAAKGQEWRRISDTVAAALQLKSKGWNAFRDHASAERKIIDAVSARAATIAPDIFPDNGIAKRHNYSETSSARLVRRQIQAGNKLLNRDDRTKPRR